MSDLRVTLLEHPRQPSWVHLNDIANAPLSNSLMSGYAASSLAAAGHETSIVEAHLGRLSAAETVAAVAANRPDLLAVHVVYDWSDGRSLADLLGQIQEASGPLPVVLYGVYPTFAYKRLVPLMPGAVAAVLGEPELALVECAAAVAAAPGGGAELAGLLGYVPGLAVRQDEAVRTTPARPQLIDLDALPAPLRTPEMLSLREVNVAGSRGCYGACSFCTINPFYGGGARWRPRAPEGVAAEMAAVLERHPEKHRFYFVDPNFFGPARLGRGRALALARLLRERFAVRFGVEGRVDDIDEEVVEALVEAGLDEILIGLESGSDATLQRLGKRTTVAQNRRALRILRAHGVEPNVGFIMFQPESTLADVRADLAFLEEERLLERLAVTANVLCHEQILLAPTPAYRLAKREGRLRPAPHEPYEGAVPFRHPEVGFLAETMAEVCRHIFVGPPESVWSADGGPATVVLADLNAYLVELFRRLLGALERGDDSYGPGLAREVVCDAMRVVVGASRDLAYKSAEIARRRGSTVAG